MKTPHAHVFAGWLLTSAAGFAAEVQPPYPPMGDLVRVHVEMIEVPLGRFNALMFGQTGPVDDGEIRRQADVMLAKGEAREVDAMTVLVMPGNMATVCSAKEMRVARNHYGHTYPKVESGGRLCGDRARIVPFATGPVPSDWDFREVGETLEVRDVKVSDDAESARFRISTESTYHARDEVMAEWKDARGDSSVRYPVFFSARFDSTVAMRTGKVVMLAAHSPMDKSGKSDPGRKVMVFARCDILHLGPHPKLKRPVVEAPLAPEDDPFADALGGAAVQEMDDPFASLQPESVPHDVAMARLRLEFVEIPRARYAELIEQPSSRPDDSGMWEKVLKWLESGEAARRETVWAVGNQGGRSKAVREITYPDRWESGQVPSTVEIGDGPLPGPEQLAKVAAAPFPSLWTRHEVGADCDVHNLRADPNDGTVECSLRAALCSHLAFETWTSWSDVRGDNAIRSPLFHKLELSGSLRLPENRCVLMAASSALDANGITDPSRKVLMFARSEMLTVKKVPKPPKAKLLQTRVEFIEVSGKTAWELSDQAGRISDKDLRQKLLGMVDKGEARMLESAAVTSPNRMRASAHSGREYFHPRSYREPEIPMKSVTVAEAPEPNGPIPIEWETSRLGFSVEAEPDQDEVSGWISLGLTLDRLEHPRDQVWYQWRTKAANSDVRMPEFETLEMVLSVHLAPGEPLLTGTLTPFDPAGEQDRSRKIFVFARCDVVAGWPWNHHRATP
ncbi:MAG: hypothetical protein J0M04_02625 [Verrucomicrobia bacterium]|nr:hypothetical protein [Verrucomicrobiota bacterium]